MTGGQNSRCVWAMQSDVTRTSLGSLYRGVLTGAGEIAWPAGQGAPGPRVNPGGFILNQVLFA
ncbi:MAG: hypothetical protein QG637_1838 [Chloroflexota bacterium]|nr:hypothetical protein [Chloroflexota bacterium]